MRLKQRSEDFIVEEVGTWPSAPGPYVLFRLTKRKLGTLDAVKKLAADWRVPVKNINYAGLKDKNAVTTQMCSVKGASRLAIERTAIRGIEIAFVGTSERPVTIGSHTSNKFAIVVRDIDALPQLKSTFLNLFGEQRFGDTNADIGKALVKQDFAKVVSLLRALRLPEIDALENHLVQQPTDLLGAVKRVPLKLLTLFVHAYQSKLWNELVKEHKLHGAIPEQLPIIGFGMESRDVLVKKIMTRESLTSRSFVLKSFPELSAEGTMRKTQLEVKVTFGKLEPDELNHGRKKVLLSFTLPPGAYATEIVRQLFTES
jgi:tRNA pseudouridine13 synthase